MSAKFAGGNRRISDLSRLTLLEVAPSFHRDLATVKLSLVLDPSLLRLLSRRLPGIAPAEVVKLPVGV